MGKTDGIFLGCDCNRCDAGSQIAKNRRLPSGAGIAGAGDGQISVFFELPERHH